MLHIYVWTPTDRVWGHCAMYVNRADQAQSRYISWWPDDPADTNWFLPDQAVARTHQYDTRLEKSIPTYEFIINQAHSHLNEQAIVAAWDKWKTAPVFGSLYRNCCSTVATLLKGPGTAASYIDWAPITWWGPNDIVEYMGYLNRHFPVIQPMVRTAPPEITRADGMQQNTRVA